MQTDGKTSVFRSLTKSCTTCNSVADRIEGIYEAGGYIKTEGWKISGLRRSKPSASGDLAITFKVASAPTEVVHEAGAKPQHLEGGPNLLYRFSLTSTSHTWKVFDIVQVAQ